MVLIYLNQKEKKTVDRFTMSRVEHNQTFSFFVLPLRVSGSLKAKREKRIDFIGHYLESRKKAPILCRQS
ncbi:Uncharacterized protein APZ42_030927 [Daphnia magna]|uniref:Uncharacterized protein n=1 Tax=Daphnia magna TaxID=35525 RepID=A0A164NFT8_9CRUS|nr:Uncharacterized protein APZ42_030927 [Daphnia magna]